MWPPRKASTAEQRALAVKAAYRTVFATPDGVLVLHDLIARGGLLRTSVVTGDSHETAYNEGRRGLMLEVLDVMRWTEGRVAALVGERLVATDDGPLAPDPIDGEF